MAPGIYESKEKILVLGCIPKALGGRSTHGLATGIFDLVDAINQNQAWCELVICAPDFPCRFQQIRSTNVIGADKRVLLRHAVAHPWRILRYAMIATAFQQRLGMSIKSALARFLLYDYAVSVVKPRFISAHGPARGIQALNLHGINKIRVVLRIHGISGLDPNVKTAESAKKQEQYAAKQTFAAVTHISNNDMQVWQQNYGQWRCPSRVILNGFDSDVFRHQKQPGGKHESMTSGLQKPKIKLTTVGSLTPRKGQLKVVKALGRLGNPNSFVYYCIGGGNPEYIREITHEAERLGVDLRLLGYMPQEKITDFLNDADFFILPSSSEGFGKVFIESIACGTPVIIPRNLPLALEPGVLTQENAIFLNDSNIESIQSTLTRLCKVNYDRSAISETVLHLRWENSAKEYVKLFSELMKS